ncbi:hypothetical protein [Flavobacterium silvaticum]|uniref:Uncharacterized protein n=1 Tax=Flavobacterium silvaticum TaxID=1852020 RepID=A0A972JK71_9FLAO|nr:hypothetical protein [Flavobacterium silvaticum]NMH28842.1 hypothetical protein [Flavobacterium silvaticum]
MIVITKKVMPSGKTNRTFPVVRFAIGCSEPPFTFCGATPMCRKSVNTIIGKIIPASGTAYMIWF